MRERTSATTLRTRVGSLLNSGFVRNILLNGEGSQLFEFALALPILLVLVMGTLDFGQVYNLKQKLNNAAREAARFAANENSGANNLAVNGVSDVSAIGDVVSNYLTLAGVTQCTITQPPKVSNGVFVYTFSSGSTGCGNFSLVIDRGYVVAVGPPVAIGTHVTLSYPYAWSFGGIMRLLLPGSTLTLPGTISTDAIMQNIN
jgi:Flp pilus assembly protein TadG